MAAPGRTNPQTVEWYVANSKMRDSVLKLGFGIDDTELKELKAVARTLALDLNPDKHTYKSFEGRDLKLAHGAAALARLDTKFHSPPEDWTRNMITQMMQHAHSNAQRRANEANQRISLAGSVAASPMTMLALSSTPQRSNASVISRQTGAWHPDTRFHILDESFNLLAKVHPLDYCHFNVNGDPQLSWEKVYTSVKSFANAQKLRLGNELYLSPRIDQEMALLEEASLRTAFRDIYEAGTRIVRLTTVHPEPAASSTPLAQNSRIPGETSIESSEKRERSSSPVSHWEPPTKRPKCDETDDNDDSAIQFESNKADKSEIKDVSATANNNHLQVNNADKSEIKDVAATANNNHLQVNKADTSESPASLSNAKTTPSEYASADILKHTPFSRNHAKPIQLPALMTRSGSSPTSYFDPTPFDKYEPPPSCIPTQPSIYLPTLASPNKRSPTKQPDTSLTLDLKTLPSNKRDSIKTPTRIDVVDVDDPVSLTHYLGNAQPNTALQTTRENRLQAILNAPVDSIEADFAPYVQDFLNQGQNMCREVPADPWKMYLIISSVHLPVYLVDVLRLVPSSKDLSESWFNDTLFDVLLLAEPRLPHMHYVTTTALASSQSTPPSPPIGQTVQYYATGEVAVGACNFKNNHWMAAEIWAGPTASACIYNTHNPRNEALAPTELAGRVLQRAAVLTNCPLPPKELASVEMRSTIQQGGNRSECGPLTLAHLVARLNGLPGVPPSWYNDNIATMGKRIRERCAVRLLNIIRSELSNGGHADGSSLAKLLGLESPISPPDPAVRQTKKAMSPYRFNESPSPPPQTYSAFTSVNLGQQRREIVKVETDGEEEDGKEDDRGEEDGEEEDGEEEGEEEEDGEGEDGEEEDGEEEDGEEEDGEEEGGEEEKGEKEEGDEEDGEDESVDAGEEKYEDNIAAALSDQSLAGRLARITPDTVNTVRALFPWVSEDKFRAGDRFCTAKVWGTAADWAFEAYQLAFLALAFVQERSIVGGGTLADVPGGGKTSQGLGHFLVHYLHVRNVKEVVEAWSTSNTTAHLPEMAAPEAKCPQSARHTPALACYCEPENRRVLYTTIPRAGLSLVVTQPGGVSAFASDAKKMLQGSRLLQDPMAPRIAIHVDSYAKDDLCQPLSSKEINRCCAHACWEDAEKQLLLQSVGPDRPTFTDAGAQATCPTATSLNAGAYASCVLIITTRGAIAGRLVKPFTATRTYTYVTRKGRRCMRYTQTLHHIGRLWIDECHNEVQATTLPKFIKIVRNDYRNAYGCEPWIWGATGTPDHSNILNNVRFSLQTLHTPAWSTATSTYQPLRLLKADELKRQGQYMTRLLTAAKKLEVTPDATATLARQDEAQKIRIFLAKYTPLFQIRRSHHSKWYNGDRVIPLRTTHDLRYTICAPQKEERRAVEAIEATVRAERERTYSDSLELWKSKGSKEVDKPTHPPLYKSASYPTARATAGIAHLVTYWRRTYHPDTDPAPSFTLGDATVATWVKDPTGSELTSAIQASNVQVSAKFKVTCKLLRNIASTKRVDGTRCKAFIPTESVGALAVWTNLLLATFPNSLVLYKAGMTTAEKKAAQAIFNTDESKWIMLATRSSVREGLNLQRANHNIIVEPSYKYPVLEQLWSRTWRPYQLEPMVYTYILVNDASRIEKRMVSSLKFEDHLQTLVSRTDVDNAQCEDDKREVRVEEI